MLRKTFHICIAALACIALAVPAGAKQTKKKAKPAAAATPKTNRAAQILGKWSQIGGEDKIEFSADGIFKAENSQLSLTGKYLVRPDGDLEIDLGLSRLTKGNIVRKVILKGDKLTLTDPKTKLAVNYERAK